ncbi:MAG: hypothetical protein P1U82_22165, partial [Verrucomicrobiales bacterium]|nr:hypothetical protein [Verrucomicrobiales bacterium]
SLLGAISTLACMTPKLPADRAWVNSDCLCNLALIETSLEKVLDSRTVALAEVSMDDWHCLV